MKLKYIIFIFGILIILIWSYSQITKNSKIVKNDISYASIDTDLNNIDEIPAHGTILDKEMPNILIEDTKEKENFAMDRIEEDNTSLDLESQSLIHAEDNMDNKDSMLNEENDSIETNVTAVTSMDATVNEEDIIKSANKWRVIERKNNYNNELQYYKKENVLLLDNKIVITSKREEKEEKEYTSGLVESEYGYLYGYFEFTIYPSNGKGIFPAIWFMPIKDVAYPEIDVFEMIGSEPEVFYGVIHYLDDNNKKSRDYFTKRVGIRNSYKVAIRWSEEELVWYINDTMVYRTKKGVPDQYMYIIINQAVGGNWPGEPNKETVFPAEFVIDNITIKPIKQKIRE